MFESYKSACESPLIPVNSQWPVQQLRPEPRLKASQNVSTHTHIYTSKIFNI